MRLIACHIENFGKLSGLDMKFGEGLNIIHEANAWGKSTLAAFLRVMFYGFESKRESGSFEKERTLYRPWQGGAYGGQLDFEHQGKRYRISRSFGKTEKSDEFHLYDLATKLECHDFSSQIGNEIFGLDSASFKRSAFIAQNDCECGSTDAINAKLGNLVENTNDINNFDSAQKLIHERMNHLSPDRATGSMKKRKNTIVLLEEELKGYEAAETASAELGGKLSQKQEQRRELSDIRSQYASALQHASEDSRRETMAANYRELCADEKRRKEALSEYEEIFPSGVPSDEEFQQRNQDVQMLGVLKTTLYNIGLTDAEEEQHDKLSEMFSEGKPSDEEMGRIVKKLDAIANCRDERSQLETKLSYYEALAIHQSEEPYEEDNHMELFIPAIVCIVVGIVACCACLGGLFEAYWYVLAIVAGAALVAAVALFVIRVFRIRSDRKEEQIEQERLQEEAKKLQEPVDEISDLLNRTAEKLLQLRDEVTEFLGKYGIDCDADEARDKLYELKNSLQEYERLDGRRKKAEETQKECDKTRQSLMEFGERTKIDFGDDIAGSLSRMQTKAAEYRLAKSAYEEAAEKKEEFEKNCDVTQLAQGKKCPYTLDELNAMIGDVDSQMEEVRESIEQYGHQMEDLQEQLDMRDEKEQQLMLCEAKQEAEKHTYHILGVTQDYLQRAKDQFSARYLGPIEHGFQKYYEMLTGDRSGGWMVNANIAVQVKEQGQMRETKWLSAGYQDLLGVCMRLALVDAMYPDEKPFLVLDDPYVNLDEEKVRCGNELLEQISADYQI
ncbi:MAG: AAA family ATPase, partial [Clostridiales bacterium]|nr:AAA family ATPase [Clostridiales bacterium]